MRMILRNEYCLISLNGRTCSPFFAGVHALQTRTRGSTDGLGGSYCATNVYWMVPGEEAGPEP